MISCVSITQIYIVREKNHVSTVTSIHLDHFSAVKPATEMYLFSTCLVVTVFYVDACLFVCVLWLIIRFFLSYFKHLYQLWAIGSPWMRYEIINAWISINPYLIHYLSAAQKLLWEKSEMVINNSFRSTLLVGCSTLISSARSCVLRKRESILVLYWPPVTRHIRNIGLCILLLAWKSWKQRPIETYPWLEKDKPPLIFDLPYMPVRNDWVQLFIENSKNLSLSVAISQTSDRVVVC